MGLLSGIFVILALAGLAYYWRRRSSETIDLTNINARRQAAARWAGQGEAEEAERLLRAAVEISEGWDRSIALADLASLLLALRQEEQARLALEEALAWLSIPPGAEEEQLEMQIQLAHLLVGADQSSEALALLSESRARAASSSLRALAGEALAEIHLAEKQQEQAIVLLQESLVEFTACAHDRAASCLVSLVCAQFDKSGHQDAEQWEVLASLPHDLQSAAIVNFCDRLATFDLATQVALGGTLLKRLEGDAEWRWEWELLKVVPTSTQGL